LQKSFGVLIARLTLIGGMMIAATAVSSNVDCGQERMTIQSVRTFDAGGIGAPAAPANATAAADTAASGIPLSASVGLDPSGPTTDAIAASFASTPLAGTARTTGGAVRRQPWIRSVDSKSSAESRPPRAALDARAPL
jgi:hypothetical protein